MLRNFWPWKAVFFGCTSLKTRYFCTLCHWKNPLFWRNVSPKDPHIWGAWWHSYVTFICECPPRDPGPPPGLCPWTPPVALERAPGPHAVRRGVLHWKTRYFCTLCHWKTPFFDAMCHRKTPTSEVLGATRTSLSYVSAPPGPWTPHRYRV